ncbi:hypothetical protein HMPREF0889_1691, partial [Megasphaera lornae]
SNDGKTRIIVKDGTQNNELATMNDGLKFMGDMGTEDKLKLNEQLKVTGGITENDKLSQAGNIGVTADGNKTLTLRLAKELTGLDGITFGSAGDALKIDGKNKTISNVGTITGLTNTTLTDNMQADQAASQGQLKEAIDKATDYRLVANESAADKKYSVSQDGEVALTVQDSKHIDKK